MNEHGEGSPVGLLSTRHPPTTIIVQYNIDMSTNSQKEETKPKEETSLDDFFAKQKTPVVRLHSAPGESKCVSCEG